MSSDCGSCIAKYILCIFNFCFFLCGTVLLAVGIWLAVDKISLIALLKMVDVEHVAQFTQPMVIEQLAYVLIVIGGLMFFLSFLGYCGAIRESTCILTTYAVFLIILLVAQITVIGLAAAYKERASTETKNFLKATITYYYSPAPEDMDVVNVMWNVMMMQMQCCGVDDYRDFNSAEKWNQHKGNRTIPDTCCVFHMENDQFVPRDKECSLYPSETNSYYKQSCYEKLVGLFMYNSNIIIGVGIAIGLVQLLGIFLAFCLCRSIDRYRVIRL